MQNENTLLKLYDEKSKKRLRMKGKIQSYDIFDGETLKNIKEIRDEIRAGDLDERVK